MPLKSTGCVARVWKVFQSTPNYQIVQLATSVKASPAANKEYKIDWSDNVMLTGNKILVDVNDLIDIKAFTITSKYSPATGKKYLYNIYDWDLHDKYDYSKLHNIEYKGNEDDEE